ncbi:MAG TPA: Fe(3+)-hydroxamate ABC transporter permease FhuB [Paenirhodobacter sp.]
MTRFLLPGAVLLSAALWLYATTTALPLAQWPFLRPVPLWHSETMDSAQILFAYGTLPRAVVAILAGAVLGLAGALMQAVLRNPLADPTTLGTAAGAQLALVAATIFAPGLLANGNAVVALSGAGLATGLVLALGAQRGFAPVTVTIAGMLIGLLASAIATAITLSQGHYLLSLVIWNGGALTQQDWVGVRHLAMVLIVALILAGLLARPLMVLSLGQAGARGLGLRTAPLRLATLTLAVLLSATVSAEVGLVGFVGLAAPAIVRRLGARSLLQRLLGAPVAGAVILSLCDNSLQAIAAAGGPDWPTGALTGLIGGPLLIWLLPGMRAQVPPGTEESDTSIRRTLTPARSLGLLTLALCAVFIAALFLGRGPTGWGVLAPELRETFLGLRATVLVAAVAAGALLATSGAVLQRLTANPMAAPEVLGVTGGAALGYAATVFALATPNALALAIGTSVGGALALAGLSAYALRTDMSPARILLAGLAIGALASAMLAAIMTADDPRAWLVLGWLAGSAAQVTPVGAAALAALAVAALIATVLMAGWLEILPLGQAVAAALGLPVGRVRLALIALAGLATGAATLLIGPVSFVGLMAPHIARSLGLVRPIPFVIGSWLLGAILMAIAAFGARSAAYPYDLPLGLFATLIGAPWLFVTLLRRRSA